MVSSRDTRTVPETESVPGPAPTGVRSVYVTSSDRAVFDRLRGLYDCHYDDRDIAGFRIDRDGVTLIMTCGFEIEKAWVKYPPA
jgi:hypothetical protein